MAGLQTSKRTVDGNRNRRIKAKEKVRVKIEIEAKAMVMIGVIVSQFSETRSCVQIGMDSRQSGVYDCRHLSSTIHVLFVYSR